MSALDLIDESKMDPGFRQVQAPASSFTDVFHSTIDSQLRAGNPVSKPLFEGLEIGERDDLYRKQTGRYLYDDAVEFLPEEEREQARYHINKGSLGDPELQGAIDKFLLDKRSREPEAEPISTYAEISDRVKTKAKEALTTQKAAVAGASDFDRWTGSLAGGAVASFADPINLASLPFGAGAAAGILRTAIVEGLINVGAEALSFPLVAAWQEELGQEYGLKEFKENAGMAFLFGAGVSGSLKGLSVGYGKAKSLFMANAARKFDELGDMPAMAAAQHEARRLHIEESNPARLSDQVDPRAHVDAIREVDAAINEGRSLDSAMLRLTDDEVRGLDTSRMDEGTRLAHERIVEASPEHSPARAPGELAPARQELPQHLDFSKEVPPEVGRQNEIAEFYESPEWKAKEEADFEEAVAGLSDDTKIFLDDERGDVSVAELRELFESDRAYLDGINFCGIGAKS